MKLRSIFLLLMIGWHASLRWVEMLGKESIHFLYPTFPLLGISYDLFWVIFTTVGFIIMLTLLGSGTTVKNKTIIKNYLPKNEPKVVEVPVEVIDAEEIKNENVIK